MKFKILTLIFLVSNLLYANLDNDAYYSIYKNLSGQQSNFKDSFNIMLENGNYRLSSTSPSASYQDANRYLHLFKNNFRIFIPRHTSKYRFFFSRFASKGWIDGFLSLNNLPNKGNYQGQYTIYTNQRTYTDNANKIFFESSSSSPSYYGYNGNEQITKLSDGWTVRYRNAQSLNFSANSIPQNIRDNVYDKWLYFATDTRSSNPRDTIAREVSYPNILEYLVYSITIILDKKSVDEEIAPKFSSLAAAYSSKCKNFPNETINACLFLQTYGTDGNDYDYNSHSITAQGDGTQAKPMQTHSVEVHHGWNFLGSVENISYIPLILRDKQSNEITTVSNIKTFNEILQTWQTYNDNSSNLDFIQKGKGFWLYSTSASPTNIEMIVPDDFLRTPVASIDNFSLSKGWNAVGAINDIDVQAHLSQYSCIDEIQQYTPNNTFIKWKKNSSDNLKIKQFEGFYIKANQNCNIKLP